MAGELEDAYGSVWTHLMTTAFKHDYVTVGGLRTRYLEAGPADAPVLVLLHGTGGHWEAFCKNIDALSEHFHLFAIDMMGCGFTDKPDQPYETADYAAHVVGFMDVMGIGRAGFIGVSLGAWVSVRIALDHSERLDRMILVAPTGYFPLPPEALKAAGVRRAITAPPTWDQTAAVLGSLLFDPAKTLLDDLVAIRRRVYSLPDIDRVMARMLTLMDPDVRARNNLNDAQWRSITQPVMLIENVDHDDIFLKTARKVATLLPDARLVPIREVSHWAQFEAPEAFNALALEFFAPALRAQAAA